MKKSLLLSASALLYANEFVLYGSGSALMPRYLFSYQRQDQTSVLAIPKELNFPESWFDKLSTREKDHLYCVITELSKAAIAELYKILEKASESLRRLYLTVPEFLIHRFFRVGPKLDTASVLKEDNELSFLEKYYDGLSQEEQDRFTHFLKAHSSEVRGILIKKFHAGTEEQKLAYLKTPESLMPEKPLPVQPASDDPVVLPQRISSRSMEESLEEKDIPEKKEEPEPEDNPEQVAFYNRTIEEIKSEIEAYPNEFWKEKERWLAKLEEVKKEPKLEGRIKKLKEFKEFITSDGENALELTITIPAVFNKVHICKGHEEFDSYVFSETNAARRVGELNSMLSKDPNIKTPDAYKWLPSGFGNWFMDWRVYKRYTHRNNVKECNCFYTEVVEVSKEKTVKLDTKGIVKKVTQAVSVKNISIETSTEQTTQRTVLVQRSDPFVRESQASSETEDGLSVSLGTDSSRSDSSRELSPVIAQETVSEAFLGKELSEVEVFQELRKLNPSCENEIVLIEQSLKKTRAEYASGIDKWTTSQIEQWERGYKRLSDSQKREQLPKMVAVLMRAAQISHKYIPRATQLASVTALLLQEDGKGKLLQIATGEGKTLTTAMMAAGKVLMGHTVDVVTSSSVLCQQNVEDQKDFYSTLGISVAVCSNINKAITYDKSVVYGTTVDFQGDILSGVRKDRPLEKSILLFDEVDSILVDQLTSLTLLSEPVTGMDALSPLFALIFNAVQENLAVYSAQETELNVLAMLQSILNGDEGQPDFKLSSEVLAIAKQKSTIWVRNAVDVARIGHKVSHIVQENGAVLPVDHVHTGITQENQTYGDGRHQFLQLKHSGYVLPETLLGKYMSTLTFIEGYGGNIYGVTGTLGDESTRRFMESVFNVDLLGVPTYRNKQFKQEATLIAKGKGAWTGAISKAIEERAVKEQPCLVIFESVAEADAFRLILIKDLQDKYAKERGVTYSDALDPSVKTEIDEKIKNQVLSYTLSIVDKAPKALLPGQILLATNLAGRGTDINVSHPEGLHVALTFLALNERIELQNLGRSARKGEPGSGQIILDAVKLREDGVIFEGEEVTLDLVRRRRNERVAREMDALRTFFVSKLKSEDRYYKKVDAAIKGLCKKSEKEQKYLAEDAKREATEELWAMQY